MTVSAFKGGRAVSWYGTRECVGVSASIHNEIIAKFGAYQICRGRYIIFSSKIYMLVPCTNFCDSYLLSILFTPLTSSEAANL